MPEFRRRDSEKFRLLFAYQIQRRCRSRSQHRNTDIDMINYTVWSYTTSSTRRIGTSRDMPFKPEKVGTDFNVHGYPYSNNHRYLTMPDVGHAQRRINKVQGKNKKAHKPKRIPYTKLWDKWSPSTKYFNDEETNPADEK
ncbi:uncharacterized protein EV420DRAFT_1480986 [Desarmillaria tabescens]|uniref:Uncharacterized protein n=1 Tax=Armillaria tabescens TaxID=1929756 RepID=A0AA39N4H7_ARMTA|nr:uncharacterized protein EV420DRAFT_1480986 [Desarmillaria tabescens]KAK0457114.1 hypothetical protein EV420DRAFT_1480986 [Desarmillaria tabescens]